MYNLRIKGYRKRKKWSQEKLATRSGVSQSEISYIESLEKSPTIYTVEKIGIALGVCPHLLIKFDCKHICKRRHCK